jgi:hypothetical protein
VKKEDVEFRPKTAFATCNLESSPWLHLLNINGLNRLRSLFVAFGNLFPGWSRGLESKKDGTQAVNARKSAP